MFDTFVRTIPDGTYLTSITQSGQRFKISGVAQSATRVSSFMRNLAASDWLREPGLDVIESKKENALGSDFTLSAEQVTTLADDATPANGTEPARRPQ